MRKININDWNRKDHYHFFSNMDNPFLGITANVNITKGYQKAKKNNISLYAYYLHQSMRAINAVPEFKLRIIDGEVYEFDTIHAGGTILREDKTFGFILTHFTENFEIFNENLQKEMINKGLDRSKLFSWEKSASEHIEIFREILKS